MGLFGGSSKTNVQNRTNVDVDVNPVFTVGIDTAEVLRDGLGYASTGLNSAAAGLGDDLGKAALSFGSGLESGAREFSEGISNTAMIVAVAAVGIATIFIISRG